MNIKTLLIAASFAFIALSCTDLEEEVFSVVPSSEYGKTPEEIKTIAGSAYASLRGFDDGISKCFPTSEYIFFLIEAVSDEFVVPNRNGDWYDKGRYMEAQTHALSPSNDMVLGAWKYCYSGITTCNFVIQSIEEGGLPKEDEEIAKAEIRGVRAYYYYLLLDWFGNVPITTSFAVDSVITNSPRAEVYDFVESELLDILDKLQPTIEYGRFTQNIANTLLARLYINSEAFIGTARWQDCIDACDNVKGYTLETDIFNSFISTNHTSKEIIWSIPFDHIEGTVGNYLLSLTYHYNHWETISTKSSWGQFSVNGPCATPGIYSSFQEGDVRKGSLLEGYQLNLVTRDTVLDRQKNLLNYTETIANINNAAEGEGCRLNKYKATADDVAERDFDWVLMRYAEIPLMKAECLVRLGNQGAAFPLVEQIRNRAKLTSTPNPITLEVLDQEWLHEFLFEGLRRSVNIRFGTYFETNYEQPACSKEMELFPIPASEMEKNSKLKQNPGY